MPCGGALLKLVAVTQRVDVIPDRNERRDALDQRLVRWLSAAGFHTVLVPNVLGGEAEIGAWLDVVKPQAFVFSGGNDVGRIPERDLTERILLNHAARLAQPVLGICRGMQMMAVFSGGQLTTVKGHINARHGLRFSAHAQCDNLPTEVNSFHAWALDGCPANFEVLAWAEDGGIEVIRHCFLPWEGWMWHPERDLPAEDLRRIRWLFSEGSK